MGNLIEIGSYPPVNNLKIRVWHRFSKTIPNGWPEKGCLFFTVNRGITVRGLLEQINKHRRPEYHLHHLYKYNGSMYATSDVIQSVDLYL